MGLEETARDSKQPWETVRDMQQHHGIGETVRDMQQLHGTDRDGERRPATVGESERHAGTPWDRERR